MACHCLASCPISSLRSNTTSQARSIGSVRQISGSSLPNAARCRVLPGRRLTQQTLAVLNVDQSNFEAEVVKVKASGLKCALFKPRQIPKAQRVL